MTAIMMRRVSLKAGSSSVVCRVRMRDLFFLILLCCTAAAARGDAIGDHGAIFPSAPAQPEALGQAARPTLVLLTATWCQWCRVLEARALPDPRVRRVIDERFRALEVDVDRAPQWMDLPDIAGLPTLAFFDRTGRHVLSKSGYREPEELALLLEAAADKIDAAKLTPYPSRGPPSTLAPTSIDPPGAAEELRRVENKLFILINDNEGGFLSPSRHPFPALLVELERWRTRGAPTRVGRWLNLTIDNALVGDSPRLTSPANDATGLSSAELRALAKEEEPHSARWFEGVAKLATQDPWHGLQDPIDHGVFRYASIAGWFHPHFERRARDNLAWVQLLRLRGDERAAARVLRFVRNTFLGNAGVAASQTSDPYYYRLRAEERRTVPAPAVDPFFPLDAAAAAAEVDPERCEALRRIDVTRWPALELRRDGATHGARAPPDVVGALLSALAGCGDDGRERAARLATIVEKTWAESGLPRTPRLWPLARGLCDAAPAGCGHALESVRGLRVDPAYVPPLLHLSRWARR